MAFPRSRRVRAAPPLGFLPPAALHQVAEHRQPARAGKRIQHQRLSQNRVSPCRLPQGVHFLPAGGGYRVVRRLCLPGEDTCYPPLSL